MAEKRGRGRPATLTHEQRKEQLRAGTAAQPPEQEVPDGMATLVLYVPMEQIIGKSPWTPVVRCGRRRSRMV